MNWLFHANHRLVSIMDHHCSVSLLWNSNKICYAYSRSNRFMFKHSSMLDFVNDRPAVVPITYVIGHDLAYCLLRHVNQNEKLQIMKDVLLFWYPSPRLFGTRCHLAEWCWRTGFIGPWNYVGDCCTRSSMRPRLICLYCIFRK